MRERALEIAFVLGGGDRHRVIAVIASVARLVRPMQADRGRGERAAPRYSDARVPETGPREVAELAAELNRMIDTSRARAEGPAALRAAMDLSGDAILLVDRASLRYVDVNGLLRPARLFARGILGKTPMDVFSVDRATRSVTTTR